MRRLQANAKRSKNQVHHKNKAKNTNYKVVKPAAGIVAGNNKNKSNSKK